MITIQHGNIYKISDYARHLKNLSEDDRYSRFGHPASDYNIDQLILQMCYHPADHELWFARNDEQRVGWGHMAKNQDGTWELAVSVDKEFQRQGVADMLMTEMIAWAKFHHVSEVYMHCIENNKVIQLLNFDANSTLKFDLSKFDFAKSNFKNEIEFRSNLEFDVNSNSMHKFDV